jgi:hypothetical protein
VTSVAMLQRYMSWNTLENPFSIEVSDAQENLQPELTYVQYDSVFVAVPTKKL